MLLVFEPNLNGFFDAGSSPVRAAPVAAAVYDPKRFPAFATLPNPAGAAPKDGVAAAAAAPSVLPPGLALPNNDGADGDWPNSEPDGLLLLPVTTDEEPDPNTWPNADELMPTLVPVVPSAPKPAPELSVGWRMSNRDFGAAFVAAAVPNTGTESAGVAVVAVLTLLPPKVNAGVADSVDLAVLDAVVLVKPNPADPVGAPPKIELLMTGVAAWFDPAEPKLPKEGGLSEDVARPEEDATVPKVGTTLPADC